MFSPSRCLSVCLPFAGCVVDRQEINRKDAKWVADRLQPENNPHVMICKKDGSSVLVEKPSTYLLPLINKTTSPPSFVSWIRNKNDLIYVGDDFQTKIPLFATEEGNASTENVPAAEWMPSRQLCSLVEDASLATMGLCLSMVQWHYSTLFCNHCGGETAVCSGGASRICKKCETVLFPRLNPAVIMTVLDGHGKVLLGERALSPQRANSFFSILAGFVSHGESIEETVEREVFEETGVKVTHVQYVFSQPWPYPFQLMLCFYAVAEPGSPITVDVNELNSAAWFSKEEVALALKNKNPNLVVPPGFSAAHFMLSRWVDGVVDDSGRETGRAAL